MPSQTSDLVLRRPRPLTLMTILLAVLLGLLATALSPMQAAQATELVKNGYFANGTDGWRTNGSGQRLSVVDTSSGRAARLTTTSTQHAVLNDAVNTVKSTGSSPKTYAVKAKVRTNTPGVEGALRFREVTSAKVIEHEKAFSLNTTSWQTVSLSVTTSQSYATMDLNVVAWDLPQGKDLLIDLVSVDNGTTTAPITSCKNQVPTKTIFGANISTTNMTITESLNQIDAAFGKVPVVRIFDPNLPLGWGSTRAKLTRDRTAVISFRPSPQEVLSGKYDTFFRNWFETAPDNQVIYWSFIHEPEPLIKKGAFTATQYKAAWKRLVGIADKACKPNMFATLILTGWTAEPASGRDYRTYDAGKDTIDVIAWDPYNGATDKDRDYYEAISKFLAPAGEVMKADGRPWGIAETGSRLVPGDDGQGRAKWLKSVGDYTINNGASFVTYFHSTRGGDYRLNDPYSRAVWRNFVAR